VHGAGPFARLAPPLPPVSPDWSPVAAYGGYGATPPASAAPRGGAPAAPQPAHAQSAHLHCHPFGHAGPWGSGCDCFAF
jgi:hypothetical protein